MVVIKYAKSDHDILECWEVVQALRPAIHYDENLRLVKQLMRNGYQLVFIEQEGKPVAFAGFSEAHSLAGGRCLYIHDLCTLPAFRQRGFASQLLHFIEQEASMLKKTAIHLDSSFEHTAAHRLYLHKGFQKIAWHFRKTV